MPNSIHLYTFSFAKNTGSYSSKRPTNPRKLAVSLTVNNRLHMFSITKEINGSSSSEPPKIGGKIYSNTDSLEDDSFTFLHTLPNI